MAFFLGIILFSGCGSSKDFTGTAESSSSAERKMVFQDAYCFGTDWQYYMMTPNVIYPKIQEIEEGCIFVHNDFLYTYRQGGAIIPLCSKANCLHDEEKDPEKKRECNACLDYAFYDENGRFAPISLMLYKDDLYICYDRLDNDPENRKTCVVKVSTDGSSKEMIWRTVDMAFPLIHRGTLFYYSSVFVTSEEGIAAKTCFNRIDLEKKIMTEEEIYYDGLQHGCLPLRALGDYVWFTMINGPNILSQVYNMRTGEIEKTDLEFDDLVLFDGKLYREPRNGMENSIYLTEIYESDVYGGSKGTVLSSVEQYNTPLSDGNYFYLDNTSINREFPERERKCVVYDTDFNIVDEYKIPDIGYAWEIPIGGKDYQYVVYNEKGSQRWGLLIFDKKEIGSIHGKECPYKILWYGDESELIQPFEVPSEKEQEEGTD